MRDDLVVVVPGVMGSGLADRDGHEVWGLSAGSALGALRTLGGSVRALELPQGVGDGPAPDGVVATGLMASLHVIPGVWTPVQGYSELLGFLGAKRFGLTVDRSHAGGGPPGNLLVFAYDWRLSNRFSAACLKCRVESALLRWRASAAQRRDAKVVFICHSMGGAGRALVSGSAGRRGDRAGACDAWDAAPRCGEDGGPAGERGP